VTAGPYRIQANNLAMFNSDRLQKNTSPFEGHGAIDVSKPLEEFSGGRDGAGDVPGHYLSLRYQWGGYQTFK
jgi:hypothetical protein